MFTCFLPKLLLEKQAFRHQGEGQTEKTTQQLYKSAIYWKHEGIAYLMVKAFIVVIANGWLQKTDYNL